MDDLEARLKQAISSHINLTRSLESRKTVHQDGLSAIKANKDLQVVPVHVGDNWFVEYARQDAVAFLNRQISRLEEEISKAQIKWENDQRVMKQLYDILGSQNEMGEQADEDEMEERDGLPTMEIREELDDEGNVISSSVRRQKNETQAIMDLANQREAKVDKPTSKSNTERTAAENTQLTQELKKQQTVSKKPPPKTVVENAQGQNLQQSDPSDTTPLQSPPEAASESSSVRDSPTATIATQDLLELELINAEIDNEDGQFEDDEEDFDEDFEFIEDSDDDEEYEDEYGRTKTNIPQISPDVLREKMRAAERALELSACAPKHEPPSTPPAADVSSEEPARTKKSVSFSPLVDIQEFNNEANSTPEPTIEDLAEEHKPEEKPKRMSRFKAERLQAGLTRSQPSIPVLPKNPEDRVVDIMERNSDMIPTGAVRSKIEENTDSGKTTTREAVSESIVERPVSNEILERPIQASSTVKPRVNGRQLSSNTEAASRSKFKGRTAVPLTLPKTNPLVDNTPNEIPKDSETDATSRDLYKRAHELFQEAIVTEEEFLSVHDTGEDVPETEEEKEAKSRPILNNEVLERERVEFDPEEDEYNADMAAVTTEYQRLRNKLINRAGGFGETDEEKAVEKIDEHGNPIKFSRFKAARLSNRTVR